MSLIASVLKKVGSHGDPRGAFQDENIGYHRLPFLQVS